MVGVELLIKTPGRESDEDEADFRQIIQNLACQLGTSSLGNSRLATAQGYSLVAPNSEWLAHVAGQLWQNGLEITGLKVVEKVHADFEAQLSDTIFEACRADTPWLAQEHFYDRWHGGHTHARELCRWLSWVVARKGWIRPMEPPRLVVLRRGQDLPTTVTHSRHNGLCEVKLGLTETSQELLTAVVDDLQLGNARAVAVMRDNFPPYRLGEALQPECFFGALRGAGYAIITVPFAYPHEKAFERVGLLQKETA